MAGRESLDDKLAAIRALRGQTLDRRAEGRAAEADRRPVEPGRRGGGGDRRREHARRAGRGPGGGLRPLPGQPAQGRQALPGQAGDRPGPRQDGASADGRVPEGGEARPVRAGLGRVGGLRPAAPRGGPRRPGAGRGHGLPAGAGRRDGRSRQGRADRLGRGAGGGRERGRRAGPPPQGPPRRQGPRRVLRMPRRSPGGRRHGEPADRHRVPRSGQSRRLRGGGHGAGQVAAGRGARPAQGMPGSGLTPPN